MRSCSLAVLALATLCLAVRKTAAQSYEGRVLLLDVDKLSQLKRTLHDMQAGYQSLRERYRILCELSEGSFRLHQAFLDSLWVVSTPVRTCPNLQEAFRAGEQLVSGCRKGLGDTRAAAWLQPEEAGYVIGVYRGILARSLRNLERLTDAVTAYRQRMTDAERLAVIDEVFRELRDALAFTHHFSSQLALAGRLRTRQYREAGVLKNLYRP